MAKTNAPTLTCKQCSYVNEPERVYCHNCGQKLDRSVLPKESEIRRESPEKAQKRIRKMTNPGKSPFATQLGVLFKTVAWGAVVAAVIQIIRPPEGAPPEKGEIPLRPVSTVVAQLAESPQPRSLTLNQVELNYLMKTQVKAKDSGVPGIKFDRAYGILLPGEVRVGVQQSIWTYPLHALMGFKPEYNNGIFQPKLVSGYVGRLPVHPAVMEYVAYAFPFRGLFASMKRERDLLQKLRDVRVEKGSVTLISRGSGAAAPGIPASPAAPAAAPAATTPAPAAPSAPTS
jgi:hypothetical protein